jgi:acetyl esterase/lipase
VRLNADRWQLNPSRVGVLGFSAGGQVASILHTSSHAAYASTDDVDKFDFKPAFSLLIYPWQVIDKSGELLEPIKVTDQSPPAFIVHTHDDASSAIGAAKIYIELKKRNVSAELHVYQNGGHGYGVREQPNSVISSWSARATDWFKIRGLLAPAN